MCETDEQTAALAWPAEFASNVELRTTIDRVKLCWYSALWFPKPATAPPSSAWFARNSQPVASKADSSPV